MKNLDARQRAMLAEMGIRLWDGDALAPTAAAVPTTPSAHPAPAPATVATVAAAAPTPAPAAAQVPAPAAQPLAPVHTDVTSQPDPSQMDWSTLQQAVAECRACPLYQVRQQTVFGTGSRQADWLVVGEAPGENEDLQGEPFVGEAGKLLDQMLAAVGRSRHAGTDQASASTAQGKVYISNIIKCRPPANRNPKPEEIARCQPWLQRQVELLQPRLILAMGRFAAQTLLRSDAPLGQLRGRSHTYNGIPVIVTYHPAYLLRSPQDKAKSWADLCLALEAEQRPG